MLAEQQRRLAERDAREVERQKALPAPPMDRAAVMGRMRARYPEVFAKAEEKTFADHAERADSLGERYRTAPVAAGDLLRAKLGLPPVSIDTESEGNESEITR